MAGTNSNPASLHNYGHVDKARWLTFHQIGNRRTHNYYAYLTEIFNTEPAVPGINGEPYYAGMLDAPGQTPTSDLYCRSGMYGSVLSGGLGGHIYGAGGWDGGLWGGNVEDAAENHIWDVIKWKSAGQMRNLAAFVLSEGRKYQQLVPKRELLQPNESGKPEGLTGWAYCARTDEKDLFLLYFEKDCPKAVLSGARPAGNYLTQWFNPQTGDFSEAVTISADSSGSITLPSFPDSSGISKTDWGMKLTVSNMQSSSEKRQAEEILNAAGIKGGLIVHIGCSDGRLTAALRANDSFLVQALDTNMRNVNVARKYLQSLGLYGAVTVDVLTGDSLPYVDNLVNLVVSEDLGPIAMDEVMRVLAPNGTAYIKEGGVWKKTVKPRSEQIDEWTHFLHDPTNNAVSDDSVVGPPEQLHWQAGPSWARSHDHLASVSAVVSSGNRLFYIEDEGPIAAVILEPNWQLVARDAFSGVLLWRRSIQRWQWHLRAFRTGPSDLSRRLVAVGDRVYVTLDIDGPLSCLDAATGKTLRTYEQTEGTLEVVCCDGKLFVVAGDAASRQAAEQAERRGQKSGFTQVRSQRPAYIENPPYKRIVVLDANSGRLIWKKADAETNELMPTTLAVGDGRVFFENADEVICLNAQSGDNIWHAARPVSRSRPTWSAPTLVVYGDVVLSADREVAKEKTLDKDSDRKVEWIVSAAGGQSPVGELIAFSAKDGKRLWSCKSRECYNAPVDCLVADGLVWTGSLVKAKDPGITEGRDPATGEVKRTRPEDKEFFTPGMNHHRCYRNKATNEYLVLGRSGVEFIDLQTGKAIPNHWVRGGCQYGVMPCNGLLYAPQDSCACFITAKLNGFKCLAPKPKSQNRDVYESQSKPEERLEKGPAYALIMGKSFYSRPADDWPTYRHDNTRSGYTTESLPAKLLPEWRVALGGRLSGVVVAEGKLFVAQIDKHTVHALDCRKGREIWSFTAGGRVDSPPTISAGRVLFGCADGWVYCLRASDGALAWRFRAAPLDRRIVSYEQLESLWPVDGSVLVRNGTVYCAAGRSSYLGGGIHLCRIDAETGRLLSETIIDDRDPETGYQKKDVVRGTNIPGALPDILSCDTGSVYMRHRRFDLMGQEQPPDVTHLFSPAGFLDDTWWHRTYWLMGSMVGTNYGGWPNVGNRVPAGRILVVDDSTVYGFGRNQYIHHGAHVGIDGATVFHYKPAQDSERRFTNYQAFAIDRNENTDQQQAKSRQRRTNAARATKTYRWTEQLPILVRAMVLAKDTLFVSGLPDIFSSDEPIAALKGRKGGLLLVLSTADGGKLAQYDLDSPPVFDGMAVAAQNLYMTNLKGEVVCWRGQR